MTNHLVVLKNYLFPKMSRKVMIPHYWVMKNMISKKSFHLGVTGSVCYLAYTIVRHFSTPKNNLSSCLIVRLWFYWINITYTNRISLIACRIEFWLNFYDCLKIVKFGYRTNSSLLETLLVRHDVFPRRFFAAGQFIVGQFAIKKMLVSVRLSRIRLVRLRFFFL